MPDLSQSAIVPAPVPPSGTSAVQHSELSIVDRILNAADWEELKRWAEIALGAESFEVGVCCGIVENVAGSVVGLLGLLKTFVLAGLYVKAQKAPAWWDILGLPNYLAAKAAELVIKAEMKAAHDQCEALAREVMYAVKNPRVFLAKTKDHYLQLYTQKWETFNQLVRQTDITSQFRAGEIFGEVLLDVIMLVLTVVGAAELAAKVISKVPELAKLAGNLRGVLKLKPPVGIGGAVAAEEGAAVEAGKAAETAITKPFRGNTATWIQDAQGRTIRVEARLRESYSKLTRGKDELAAQGAARDAGEAGDAGGHILGHRFMGDQGGKNLFPQEANFNNSAYRTMENELADWTAQGKEVHVTFELEPPGATRPDVVKVAYEVIDPATGETVNFHAEKFYNEPGQTFKRVSSSDMAE